MVKQAANRVVRFEGSKAALRVWGIYANGGAVDFVVDEEKAQRRAVEVARTLGVDIELVEFEPTAQRLVLRRSA